MTETSHLETTDASPMTPWVPTATEVAAIVEEMRPIILAFAERYRLETADPNAPKAPKAPPHAA